MNYILASEIVNEVESNLFSYFQSGTVDSGILYPVIQRSLALIGVNILPFKSATLNVQNYTVSLPIDYNSLKLAILSETSKIITTPIQGVTTYEQAVTEIPICKTECDYGYNEFGRFQVIQRINHDVYYHTSTKILTVGNQISGCVNPYNFAKYDVEIKNNEFLCQFETGQIYIEYRALLEDNKEILVPDYSEIKTWLIAECEKKILKYVYFNTTDDVSQRLQYSDKELHIAMENARTFWKRHSVSEFNDLKRYLQNNFLITSRIDGNYGTNKLYSNSNGGRVNNFNK